MPRPALGYVAGGDPACQVPGDFARLLHAPLGHSGIQIPHAAPLQPHGLEMVQDLAEVGLFLNLIKLRHLQLIDLLLPIKVIFEYFGLS